MRGEGATPLIAAVAAAIAVTGCANPLDRMCASRADYFEQCAGVATEGGWNLVKDWSFYGYGGRDEFVQACSTQGEAHVEAIADETERKRLKMAFEDEALKYEVLIEQKVCGQVP